MTVTVVEEPIGDLPRHAETSIAFLVEQVLEVSVLDQGLGGIALRQVAADSPYWKDYDAGEGAGPARWAEIFDVSAWGLLTARDDGERVGGAVVAFGTPDVHLLEGRRDLAVLWDLRVRPGSRSAGVGAALFRVAEDWARERGCRRLKIETQNVNAPACRFYARMGCTLGAINLHAYPDLPAEAQLLWYRDL